MFVKMDKLDYSNIMFYNYRVYLYQKRRISNEANQKTVEHTVVIDLGIQCVQHLLL